jgi:hypothetical protein
VAGLPAVVARGLQLPAGIRCVPAFLAVRALCLRGCCACRTDLARVARLPTCVAGRRALREAEEALLAVDHQPRRSLQRRGYDCGEEGDRRHPAQRVSHDVEHVPVSVCGLGQAVLYRQRDSERRLEAKREFEDRPRRRGDGSDRVGRCAGDAEGNGGRRSAPTAALLVIRSNANRDR